MVHRFDRLLRIFWRLIRENPQQSAKSMHDYVPGWQKRGTGLYWGYDETILQKGYSCSGSRSGLRVVYGLSFWSFITVVARQARLPIGELRPCGSFLQSCGSVAGGLSGIGSNDEGSRGVSSPEISSAGKSHRV